MSRRDSLPVLAAANKSTLSIFSFADGLLYAVLERGEPCVANIHDINDHDGHKSYHFLFMTVVVVKATKTK